MPSIINKPRKAGPVGRNSSSFGIVSSGWWTLVALRSGVSSGTDAERADVKLESDAVTIQFFVAQLPWEITSEVVDHFRVSFAK
jgi:hypothetical protein